MFTPIVNSPTGAMSSSPQNTTRNFSNTSLADRLANSASKRAGLAVLTKQNSKRSGLVEPSVSHADSSASLKSVLLPFFNNDDLSDVTIIVGDEEFPAHRIILAAWSAPFKAMFSSGMREAQDKEVHIEDVDPHFFKLMLKFMYTGSIKLNGNSCLPLLSISNRYEVNALKEQCEEYISRKIDTFNCCSFLSAAERFTCEDLYSECMKFIKENFQSICGREEFRSLNRSCLKDLIKSCDIVVDKEETVLEALIDWASENKEEDVEDILQYIRFPLLSVEYLARVVENNTVLSQYSSLRDLLFEAYRFHALSQADVDIGLVSDASTITQGISPSPVPASSGTSSATYPLSTSNSASLSDAGSGTDRDRAASPDHVPIVFEDEELLRRRERGVEMVVFGEGCGQFRNAPGSLSENYQIAHIRQKDDKYWLPASAEKAVIEIMFDKPCRITALRLHNRHSKTFSVSIRMSEREEWRDLIPRTPSGPHKCLKEFQFKRKEENPKIHAARFMRVRLEGRPSAAYHTSIYWLEVRGKALPVSVNSAIPSISSTPTI